MDTTRLDVFAFDPFTLKWVQAELTVGMDWYTRCITGLRLTPVSTKAVDAAAVLYQAFRPRSAGAHWPRHTVWPDHGIPRTVLIDVDAFETRLGQSRDCAGDDCRRPRQDLCLGASDQCVCPDGVRDGSVTCGFSCLPDRIRALIPGPESMRRYPSICGRWRPSRARLRCRSYTQPAWDRGASIVSARLMTMLSWNC